MTRLVPMTDREFLAYAAEAIPSYAADKVACGQWPQEESLELSRKSFEELLPRGLATAGHHLLKIVDDRSVPVGTLWFAVQDRAGKRIAYVYEVSVEPQHRRQGHAARAFLALEDEVRARGLSGIALHVFGHNAGAQALYAKLGYQTTNINMFKSLPNGEHMTKPIMNLDEVEFDDVEDNGYYTSKRGQISDHIGARQLGYNLTVLPPGKAQCPLHNHHGEEEMFLVLEGEGELRFGDRRYRIRKHDVIACPTGGPEVAHQIINTGTTPMRYLALSNVVEIETCEYPDSNKVMIASGRRGEKGLRKIFRAETTVDYYDRESTEPPKGNR